MKKLSSALIVAFVLMLGMTPGQAEAKDMSGRFGMGADTTLGYNGVGLADTSGGLVAGFDDIKIPGLSVIYQTSKLFGIQVIFATNITTGTLTGGAEDVNVLITEVSVGARGIINIALTEDVNLGLPVGVTVINRTSGTDASGDDGASALYLAFEAGIRPEYFVTNWFSIHTQIGLTLSVIPGEAEPADPKGVSPFNGGGFGVNLFGAANLLGNAGFTFWF